MIKEPEDEAFEELEKAQERKWGISLNTVTHPRGAPALKEDLNPDSLETIELELPEREPLLVDKGCAERGCMGYDSRDGDKPVMYVEYTPCCTDQTCPKCKAAIARPRTWVELIRGVRVEGDTVIVSVRGGNEAARALCGALIEEIDK
jgi:hypothetical protein